MPLSICIQTAVFCLLAFAALFVSAGTLALPTYWVYFGTFAGLFAASLVLVDPDLVRERIRPGGKRAPRRLHLFTVALLVHWIVAGLDHGRFHWSDTVPLFLQWLALAAVAAGYALSLWAMRVNRFFSSAVRIQSDRGQVVVTAGPYAYVRHPGYIAAILLVSASGIALDSWLATAFLIACAVPFLLYRTVAEDRMLRAELPGYREYAERVRRRLLPAIW
jgi:protein-S-isoprenylcysteine O-methyltransferase Ste14